MSGLPAASRSCTPEVEGVMTEPSEVAEHAETVVDGLYHWRIHNSHIGGSVSSSQALQTADGLVLIDPVRLEQHELERLGTPAVVALTAKCHQRAAWRYRREHRARVWPPQDARPGGRGAGRALHRRRPATRRPSRLPHAGAGVAPLRVPAGGPARRSVRVGPHRRRRARPALHPAADTRGPRTPRGAAWKVCWTCPSASCAWRTARR